MKLKFNTGATFAALTLAATLALPAHAQMAAPAAGGQLNAETGSSARGPMVKMDAKEFMRTHHWDETSDTWSVNPGVSPPAGVASRADVKAQRDLFLSKNRWNNVAGQYEPIGPVPRDMSTLTREQVKAETMQFMRTHSYDEETAAWVAVPIPAKTTKR